jgi:transcriptional antiterminator RfaH
VNAPAENRDDARLAANLGDHAMAQTNAVTGAHAGALQARAEGAWFCLRTQPKHEHIAAAHLREEPGVEVYLPRIRFRRSTRKGPAWFTEALFPNYLFARFDLATCWRRVHHGRGVREIVHFAGSWPTIPEEVIADLKRALPGKEAQVLPGEAQAGDAVEISGGIFHGLRAVVTRVMPARQRVAVLLDFLGRQTSVELPKSAVIPEASWRREALPSRPE